MYWERQKMQKDFSMQQELNRRDFPVHLQLENTLQKQLPENFRQRKRKRFFQRERTFLVWQNRLRRKLQN